MENMCVLAACKYFIFQKLDGQINKLLFLLIYRSASTESYVTLNKINNFGTASGEPTEVIRIAECGVAFPPPMNRHRRVINLSEDDDPDVREDKNDDESSVAD